MITAVFSLCFLIVGKIFLIQIVDFDNFANEAITEGMRLRTVEGSRGSILDRNGHELAQSITRYTIWANTTGEYDSAQISQYLSSVFGKPIQDYKNRLNKRKSYIPLENNTLLKEGEIVFSQVKNIKGLEIDRVQHRHYPYNSLAAQLIGFIDADKIGQVGIEKQFDEALKGKEYEVKYKKSIRGKMVPEVNSKSIVSRGDNITLTIDVDLQTILQDELNKGLEKYNAQSVNGVIIDPFTGEIIAMATVPDFNLNYYNTTNVEYFQNKVISTEYEPGSTYKIVATAAMLEANGVNSETTYFCENGEYLPPAGRKILHDHEPHDDLSIYDIFAYSSNIGVAKMSQDLGAHTIYDYSRKFGFGNITYLSLPNEASGKLRGLSEWTGRSNISVPIGQEISVTTLQLAMAYSTIANGGYLIEPKIVSHVEGDYYLEYTNKTELIRQVVSSETTQEIMKMLTSVVDYGTGTNAKIPGYLIGGKTGTAEKFIDGKYSKHEFISSFASIFPIDNPKYVCIVTVDTPQYGFHWGNMSSAPITKEIYKRIINSDNTIKPSTNSKKQELIAENKQKTTTLHPIRKSGVIEKETVVPNFVGLTLKSAINTARGIGLTITPSGTSGRVVWQSIKPGKRVSSKECILKMEIVG